MASPSIPAGFYPVGKISDAPPIIQVGEPQFDRREIRTLQGEHKVSFTMRVDYLVPDLGVVLFGPLFAVWVGFSKITPFWYLQGDDDD